MSLFEKVMIVDDNDIDLFIHEKILIMEELAAEVISQHSPADGLIYLENASENDLPDLILLDISMPVMDGFEFLRACEIISSKKSSHKISICFLTSSTDTKDKTKALTSPLVKAFFSKPLDVENFKAVLHQIKAQGI